MYKKILFGFDGIKTMVYTGPMKRIACAFSVSKEFLDQIDVRAKSLGLSRSGYIVQVLRKEIISGDQGLKIVAEEPVAYSGTNEEPTGGSRRPGRKRRNAQKP